MRVYLYITDKKNLKARIRIHNNTQDMVYLYLPRLFPDGQALNNYFQFEPRENVTYVGPMVKRKPFAEEDLIALPPAELFISDEIDLKSLYTISSRKKLKVRYLASHPLDGFKKGDHMIETDWEDLDDDTYINWDSFSERMKRPYKPRLEV